MAVEIKIPRLGWTMEEGTFMGWLKQDGDAVRAGEPLYTLEGDKAIEEIEATDSGILRIASDTPREGDAVVVGRMLGHLLAEGEARPEGGSQESGVKGQESEARRQESGVRNQAIAVPRAPSPAHRIAVSPRAGRAARELGVDLQSVRGTGRNGRIRERDVLAAAAFETGREQL